MTQKTIIIAKPNLTKEEIALSRRFLTESHYFSAKQSRQVRQVNDKLAGWGVLFKGNRYTFKEFYRTFINGTYAYPLLNALPQLTDIAKEGLKVQARAARKIVQWLRANEIERGQVAEAEYLVIYCLYQWGAFARGYIFEATILRDLQDSGVSFTPHDPILQRYARYDLHIPTLGYGDIKMSLYFLENFTARSPKANFYITRIYSRSRRQHVLAVFLNQWSWRRLQATGYETVQVSSISNVIQQWPKVVQLRIDNLDWFVIEYKTWKDFLCQKQGNQK